MFAQHKFPRFALVLILLIGLCAGLFAPKVGDVEAKPNMACPGGVITQWTFWDGTSDTVLPTTGSGIFSNGLGVTPSIPPYTFFAGNPDRAISFSGWASVFDANDYVEFAVDTTARSDIRFSFDYRSTATGPSTLEIHYSTDGISFTPFNTISLTRDANFYSLSYDLSSITGINNSSNTKFRLYGYGATGGNLRLDNITIFEICPTPTPTNTFTPTDTLTPSLTPTITNTPIFSLTPSLTPAPGQVIISEVAWAGTRASPDDEWIELYNTRPWPIDLTGWRLVNLSGSVDIVLSSIIPANGFLLLERGSNQTVSNILVPANQIYTGALADTNDLLRLRKPDGTIIDTANSNVGSWPAGGGANAASMERYLSGSTPSTDNDFGWLTGVAGTGLDAASNAIYGTPGVGNLAFTVTPTFTPIVTSTSTPAGTRSVIINEIAWTGTASGLADDEWIELYNTTNAAINITGWRITASDGTPNISLVGIIPARGYFLLERGANATDDTTVSDIPADQIYTGNALSNSGEALTLYDSANRIIDTANGNGGTWPAGSATTYGTMERILNTADSDSAWITNNGTKRNGRNANGGNILGTPKNSNSIGPTPTPSRAPTITFTPTFPIDPRPIINEILARPGFDWNQDGRTDVYDEFIEIKNLSPIDINLRGWKLDKLDGATIFNLPDVILKPNERIVFYSSNTNLLLSDGGETIRLINPSGKIYDAYTYTVAKEADKSFCRLPDGNVFGNWFEDCIPTPNLTNTREGKVPTSPDGNTNSCDLPDTIPVDFFFAECGGYGAKIWNPFYWDDLLRIWLQNNNNKWETFIE
ncbi:MAG: lamin tail domain-containing protein [Anaerolineales bacterium]|nr:lamin tail domain-containing protein [Anaerolineales bacterium]